MNAHRLLPVLAVAALAATPSQARRLDPAKAEDALAIMQKTICSTKEGETVIHWWKGGMFARVEGEKDRKLFDIQGMNIRQCQNLKDAKRGPGFRAVSREIMIHLDPATGQIQDRWTNPWTGEALEVIHVANDPVNMRRPIYAYGEDGKPLTVALTIMNGRAFRTGNTPLFYDNPLGGAFQDWVGGKYHAQEMGSDFFYVDDLFDSKRSAPGHHTLSWTRLSSWLPWMKMGDRNGVIYTSTIGGRVASLDKLPEPLRSVLKERYPQYAAPPPLDDARPNETSWEVFKKRKAATEEKK